MSVFLGAFRRNRSEVVLETSGVFSRLLARWDARVALACLMIIAVAAIIGPFFTLAPDTPQYDATLLPPSGQHLLGTDETGRDLLARTLWGARLSLGSALLVSLITATSGLLIGVLAGCAGGVIDTIICRLVDILLGLPGLIITLAIVGLLGPGFFNLVLAMCATGWASFARLARAVSKQTMLKGYVKAATMSGVSLPQLAVSHVLPSAAGSVAVVATLGIGEIVIALAGLSFLGLGVQPPSAEWGTMLAAARQSLSYAPWQLIGPATGLVLTVLCATVLSEALRDVTDPGVPR